MSLTLNMYLTSHFPQNLVLTKCRFFYNQDFHEWNPYSWKSTPIIQRAQKCKEPSIISRTCVAIWSKTNFGPTDHHCPQSSPLPRVCTVPSGPSVLTSMGGTEENRRRPSQARRVGRGCQSCCVWSKIPWWKRKCEMVHCCDVTASSLVNRVPGKAFADFHGDNVKRRSSMRNSCLACQDKFFEHNPLDACSLLRSLPVPPFFSLGEFALPMYGSCFLPQSLSNHCHSLLQPFSEIFTKFDAAHLSTQLREILYIG
jgi:hypothetical protein